MEQKNRLDGLFSERSINVSDFARKNGINQQTLYHILRVNEKLERTSVDIWLKIAHGLGMTADELYEYCFVELPDDEE